MNRRLLLQAVTAVMLFAILTVIVRIGINDGSRESAWIVRPFGDWPEDVHDVQGTSDLQFSIFATYTPTDATTRLGGAVPDMVGRAAMGPVVDSLDSDNINGSRFTTGSRAGALSSISAYVAAPVDESPNDQFQLAIYEDAGGAPSHLLATTASGRLVPDAWNTVAIHALLQPSTSYWLMYNTNGTTGAVNNLTYVRVVGTPLDNAIRSHRTDRLVRLADRTTAAGALIPTAVAIIVLSLVAARRSPRAGAVLLVGFLLANFVTWVLKETTFDPYASYPSGHAMRATYLAVAFCFVVTWRGARLVAALFVALIAVASVYSGGHYSEEVIGGVLLGWATATAAKALAGDPTKARVPPAVDVDDVDRVEPTRATRYAAPP
jgi:membrane-associated phospholipid phosphatase